MFKRVGSLLGSVSVRSKQPEAILALRVRGMAKEALVNFLKDLPESIEKQIKVKTFKNGVLTIVTPTAVAAELHMRGEGLKDAVNKAIGRSIVHKIMFRSS